MQKNQNKRGLLIFNHLVLGQVWLFYTYCAYSAQKKKFLLIFAYFGEAKLFLRLFLLLDLVKLGQRRVALVPVRFVCVLVS